MTAVAVLGTERLILRRWQASDRPLFAQINADPRVMEFLTAPLSHTESDLLADRIEAHFQRHGYGMYAVDSRADQAFIGFIGLNIPSFDSTFTPCVEVGWRLASDYWGKGLATEGAKEVVRYAFEELRLGQLVAFTVPAKYAFPSRHGEAGNDVRPER